MEQHVGRPSGSNGLLHRLSCPRSRRTLQHDLLDMPSQVSPTRRDIPLQTRSIRSLAAFAVVAVMGLATAVPADAGTPSSRVSIYTTTTYQPEGIVGDRHGNLYINSNDGAIGMIAVDDPTHATVPVVTGGSWGYCDLIIRGRFAYVNDDTTIWKASLVHGTFAAYVTSGVNGPGQMAFDGDGNLYIANSGDGSITKAPPGGGAAVSIGATGLTAPWGLALVGKTLWVSDGNFSSPGALLTVPVTGGAAVPVFTPVSAPQGSSDIVVDPAGNVFMASENDDGGVIIEAPAGGQAAFELPSTGVVTETDYGLAWTRGKLFTEDWMSFPFNVLKIRYTAQAAPPRRVTAHSRAGAAEVSWSRPTFIGHSPITGYRVVAAPGGESCRTTGARSCTVRHLSPGVRYRFRVASINALGRGGYSKRSNGIRAG